MVDSAVLPDEVQRRVDSIMCAARSTSDEELQSIISGEVVHFAGHAQANPKRPLESSLELANGERLALSDVLNAEGSSRKWEYCRVVKPHCVVRICWTKRFRCRLVCSDRIRYDYRLDVGGRRCSHITDDLEVLRNLAVGGVGRRGGAAAVAEVASRWRKKRIHRLCARTHESDRRSKIRMGIFACPAARNGKRQRTPFSRRVLVGALLPLWSGRKVMVVRTSWSADEPRHRLEEQGPVAHLQRIVDTYRALSRSGIGLSVGT
jgi:hypothetical protein